MKIKLAVVDDHQMLRNGLAQMLTKNGFDVLFEANNGKDCISQLDTKNLPEVLIMDINMPLMNGFETSQWVKQHHPSIKILALSMYDSETTIIKMLRCGANGYLLKDSSSKELILAIETIHLKGFYSNDMVSTKMMKAIYNESELENTEKPHLTLTERELGFLKLCCTEMVYKEIAAAMKVSNRTIDGYREILFEKLNVRTRIGLVIHAIKNQIIVL